MSFILDALKKAEAERHLGSVPHLHAQPAPPAAPVGTRTKAWRPALLGLLVLPCAGLPLAWWLWPAQREAVYTQTVTTMPAPAAQLPGLSTPAVMSSVPPPAPPPPPRKTAAEKTPRSAATADVASAEEAQSPLELLPEALRRDLPALSVNGYIYAERAADRSVLINNKLLREGEQVTPELLLEKITPQGLVLNFRGSRFRRAY